MVFLPYDDASYSIERSRLVYDKSRVLFDPQKGLIDDDIRIEYSDELYAYALFDLYDGRKRIGTL